MDIILNKLYCQADQNNHKIKFGDLYNELNDYLNDMKIDYIKYNAPSDDECAVVSSLSMGIFAVLKTFSDNKELQKTMIKKFIEELMMLVKSTNYSCSQYGFFQSLHMIWTGDDIKLGKKIPNTNQEFSSLLFEDDSFNHRDYYFVLDFIKKLFKSRGYVDEYANQLTLSVFTFIQIILSNDDRNNLLDIFLNNLKEMDNLAGIHNFYEKPNFRGYISY